MFNVITMKPNKRKDKTMFETNVIAIGGSLYISLPKEIQNHVDVEEKDSVNLMAEFTDEHGPYVSMWNPDQQKNQSLRLQEDGGDQ